MQLKDYHAVKPIYELVVKSLAMAEKEVIGEVEVAGKEAIEEIKVAVGSKTPRRGKGVISEEAPAEEAVVEEAPAEETPVEESPVEEIGHPRTAIDLKCMEPLREAIKFCEEHEIFGT